jgi:hypothetical protein
MRRLDAAGNSVEVTVASLSQLLREAAAAHHDAFASVNGDDPEWPTWYATYLLDAGLTTGSPVESQRHDLAALLRELDAEYRAIPRSETWDLFDALTIVSRAVDGDPTL